MKRKFTTLFVSLLLTGGVAGFLFFPVTDIAAAPNCSTLNKSSCNAKAACRWSPKRGKCVRRHSECSGLSKSSCKGKAKCRWVDKSSRSKAYCRRK